MSKKIVTTQLVMFSLCLVFVSVFAATDYATIDGKLDNIISDARSLVADYESFLANNEAVLGTIPSFEDAKALKDNMLKEDVETTINSVISELNSLGTPEAISAKAELEAIKAEAKTLVNDSQDVVDEVKTNYESYTSDEIVQLVEKVQDMVDEFGITNSSVPTYAEISAKVDNVVMHADVLNAAIQSFVDDHHEFVYDNASKDILEKLLDARSITSAIDVLEAELNSIGTTQAITAKEDLLYIETVFNNLKNDTELLAEDFKKSYVFLKSSEVEEIKKDLQNIVDLYVDLANYFVDTYSDTYITKVKDKIYSVEPLTIITKIDDLIDTAYEYEQKIKDVADSAVDKFSEYVPMLAVFGMSEDEIKSKVENKVSTYADKATTRLADEFEEYLNYMTEKYETTIKNIAASTADLYNVKQTNVAKEIEKFFDIRVNFVALINRVSTEIETRVTQENTKSDVIDLIDAYEELVLNAIDELVLYAVETNFGLEEEIFKYLADERIFVFDDFSATSVVKNVSGIDVKYFEYASLKNNKIATSSKALIKLSDTIQEVYQFAVLGDVNSDGAWDISDVVMVIDESINNTNLAGVEYIASDINSDDVCDITDVVMAIDKGLQI